MPGAKSFHGYVRSRRAADDHATGGFIAEAKSDARLPNIKSWRELRSYLLARGAPHEMFVAAWTVWRDYQRQIKG